jgi:hypothetical protein
MITDQAEGVFDILMRRMEKQEVQPADCQALFSSEGYQRLKKREASMGRPFTDEEFLEFLHSDELLEDAYDLLDTLDQWKSANLDEAARRALAYLPDRAIIAAKIYPVIKPKKNSFVFELDSDPAIFLYLDPTLSQERFINTLAHELHHIGFSSIERVLRETPDWQNLSNAHQDALEWVTAFGEGLAMLAAAGGPEVHPHALSPEEDRRRWEADLDNFNQDLPRLDKFLTDVLSGTLHGEAAMKAGYEFFGVQGPWYTVGWQMAVLIEKYEGRQKVIESFCNPWRLLSVYNHAARRYYREAATPLAMWSDGLVEGLAAGLPDMIIPTQTE